MNPKVLPRALRALAVAIAIAAAIDPVVTSNRTGRPDISVVAGDPLRDSASAAQVARALAGSFTVTPAPFPAASATVLVGSTLPGPQVDLAGPVFAVIPEPRRPSVAIEGLTVFSPAPLHARSRVDVAVHTIASAGDSLVVRLLMGSVVVDERVLMLQAADTVTDVRLGVAPVGTNPALLRATATIRGVGADHADLAVDVHDSRAPVLFYDPRPSWQSTFVRRAIEGDLRFDVTSRVITSRNISTDAGAPPPSLDDASALAKYDVIVVGAPDALTDRDVAGLEGFMRRRGGSVILLLDQRTDGPYQRLIGPVHWLDNVGGRRLTIAPPFGEDSAGLLASEILRPEVLPPDASPLANALAESRDGGRRSPVIWSAPIGAGNVVVSGALDAWRYRDSTVSGFDRFWRTQVASAAQIALPPVRASAWPSVVMPGEQVNVFLEVRDPALSPLPSHTSVSATLQRIGDSLPLPVRFWPTPSVGRLQASFRAPTTPGAYRLAVSAQGQHATTAFVVAAELGHPKVDDVEFLKSWVGWHGGRALPAAELARLPAALVQAIHLTPRPTRWHPMRSPWWLLPFAFALSGEWWWRRRRGLA